MFAERVRNRRWTILFTTVASLILAQLIWWTTIFLRDVDKVADLRLDNLALSQRLGQSDPNITPEIIRTEAFHRRVMFLSESMFFVILAVIAHYLLYRALSVESRSREVQKSFIEIVSHESKTPLTALKLRLEALKDKRRDDERVTKELDLALSEVRRLASLFDRVLNLNRLERQGLNFEAIYLADIVQEVVARLEPFSRAHGATVKLEMDPDAVVLADSQGLQSTLQSLIENAILYNDKKEKVVRLSVKAEAGQPVLLEIADNGPGIDAAEQDRVFERFYRSEKNYRTPGSGLGLYIAKQMIEAHQGVIRLISNLAQGSRFQIELPAVKG